MAFVYVFSYRKEETMSVNVFCPKIDSCKFHPHVSLLGVIAEVLLNKAFVRLSRDGKTVGQWHVCLFLATEKRKLSVNVCYPMIYSCFACLVGLLAEVLQNKAFVRLSRDGKTVGQWHCNIDSFVKGNVCRKIRTIFSLVDIDSCSFTHTCLCWTLLPRSC